MAVHFFTDVALENLTDGLILGRMSNVYIGVLVTLIAPFLPKMGLNIDNPALTTTITTLVTVCGALWALIARFRMGGVNFAGLRR